MVVSATNETRVWDTRTWQVVFRRRRLDASDIAAPATFRPDSRLLVISDDQTNLPLIDTSTWNEVTSFQCPEAAYGGDVRFSPQEDLLARYAGNRSQVWNIAKLRAHLRKAGLDW